MVQEDMPMNSESRTPEEPSNPCHECGYDLTLVKSLPPPHVPCPNCGISPWDDPAWEMLSEFLVPEACLPAIGSCTKEEAVLQMVEALIAAGAVTGITCDEIMELLWKRESLGTTGVGHHVAVPHIKHPKVDRLVGCLAHSVDGIDYGALDDEPVHLLMLYLIPADRPNEAFRALNLLARIAAPRIEF